MQEVTRTNNLKGEKVKYEIIPTPPCLFYTVVAAGSSCSSISTISNVSASEDALRSRRLQQNAVTRSAKRRSYVKSASDAIKNPGRRKAFQHSEKNSEKLFASTGIARKYAYEILRCQREWRKKNPTQQYWLTIQDEERWTNIYEDTLFTVSLILPHLQTAFSKSGEGIANHKFKRCSFRNGDYCCRPDGSFPASPMTF